MLDIEFPRRASWTDADAAQGGIVIDIPITISTRALLHARIEHPICEDLLVEGAPCDADVTAFLLPRPREHTHAPDLTITPIAAPIFLRSTNRLVLRLIVDAPGSALLLSGGRFEIDLALPFSDFEQRAQIVIRGQAENRRLQILHVGIPKERDPLRVATLMFTICLGAILAWNARGNAQSPAPDFPSPGLVAALVGAALGFLLAFPLTNISLDSRGVEQLRWFVAHPSFFLRRSTAQLLASSKVRRPLLALCLVAVVLILPLTFVDLPDFTANPLGFPVRGRLYYGYSPRDHLIANRARLWRIPSLRVFCEDGTTPLAQLRLDLQALLSGANPLLIEELRTTVRIEDAAVHSAGIRCDAGCVEDAGDYVFRDVSLARLIAGKDARLKDTARDSIRYVCARATPLDPHCTQLFDVRHGSQNDVLLVSPRCVLRKPDFSDALSALDRDTSSGAPFSETWARSERARRKRLIDDSLPKCAQRRVVKRDFVDLFLDLTQAHRGPRIEDLAKASVLAGVAIDTEQSEPLSPTDISELFGFLRSWYQDALGAGALEGRALNALVHLYLDVYFDLRRNDLGSSAVAVATHMTILENGSHFQSLSEALLARGARLCSDDDQHVVTLAWKLASKASGSRNGTAVLGKLKRRANTDRVEQALLMCIETAIEGRADGLAVCLNTFQKACVPPPNDVTVASMR